MNTHTQLEQNISGEFVTLNNERCYLIKHVDQMDPFFISVISSSDHWMFIGSNGALTAGRVSPDTALFPYECVDKIYDDALNTGCKTIVKVNKANPVLWEPFNHQQTGLYKLTRNIYKNTLGNKLYFEETNHDLGLRFIYSWQSSDDYGFVRKSKLINESDQEINIELIDGIQNVLPAGTPKFTQTVSSNLVDAYKWNEVDTKDGLALFTLYSAITDRAEPSESLRATTVFSLGIENPMVLLSNKQLSAFRNGKSLNTEETSRGIRGAYLTAQTIELKGHAEKEWQIIANLEQSQAQIAETKNRLLDTKQLQADVSKSIENGDTELASIMAKADGFQLVNEEVVGVHHYANTLFNILRGGIFSDQYTIHKEDFVNNIKWFNKAVFNKHQAFFDKLPKTIAVNALLAEVSTQQDPQLERLSAEYLPIYFGRRHGDPSRPWNQFLIKLKDEQQNPLLTYQGNWRDIFQNWEALAYSYPEFIEGMIAKFVNASTLDGYNPYRITKEGIDWEVEEPDDPWSYIGYWGDHQIIYLQKLLELSVQFHPEKLQSLLHQKHYCYANVPYKIKPFSSLLENAKDTVEYDETLAQEIEKRTEKMGADGKLLLNDKGEVYQVNLLEKLLVPLLCKLGNLVVDGGIWLNTQRPEWNDANNALVGQGLSVVTLNYLRRYVRFFQDLIADIDSKTELSSDVATWLVDTHTALSAITPHLHKGLLSPQERYSSLALLGKAASHYRMNVYKKGSFSGQEEVSIETISRLLKVALTAIDHTISSNKRSDGMYHAYNLLALSENAAHLNHLSPMLEGQVAALSSGGLSPQDSINVVDALFASDVYREDQQTFMLYPDKTQTPFMQKNSVNVDQTKAIASLSLLLTNGDKRLIEQDTNGHVRFHADIKNKGELALKIDGLSADYPEINNDREAIYTLFEATFNHLAFTGRSGGMFGFEGLGSVYWHMVSKLLLAIGENIQIASTQGIEKGVLNAMCSQYYRVREGIGFNKTPQEYGAFPCDPYSHTPKHAGAQQPGMTGQVKEELIARFIELGIQIKSGDILISPILLRKQEFLSEAVDFTFLDIHENWHVIPVLKDELAFTWCQVPFVYRLDKESTSGITVYFDDESILRLETLNIPSEQANHIFARNGKIIKVVVDIHSNALCEA